MRLQYLALLLMLSCRPERLDPAFMCGQDCYPEYLKKEHAGVGACHLGVWTCKDNDTTTATCEQFGTASTEVCNGVDDDCDGSIDEDIPGCCVYPQPEVCNGKDDDCDGQIDEADAFEPTLCYDGPQATLAFGSCRPGVMRCVNAKMTCFGETLPGPETCNGLDDDCDGTVDEGLRSEGVNDLVFIIDNSFSMADKIREVQLAAQTFATQYQARTDIRWTLVTAPDDSIDDYGPPKLVLNAGTAKDFQVAMGKQTGKSACGTEPTMDAIEDVCVSGFGINWTPGSRRTVIIFSDEVPQSYVNLPSPTPHGLGLRCAAAGIPVNVFTDDTAYVTDVWHQVADPTTGRVFKILAADTVTNLESLVSGIVCQ